MLTQAGTRPGDPLPMLRSEGFEAMRDLLSPAGINVQAMGRARAAPATAEFRAVFTPAVLVGSLGLQSQARFSLESWCSPWLLGGEGRAGGVGLGDFFLYFPVRGRMRVAMGDTVVESDGRDAIVLSPTGPSVLSSSPDTLRLSYALRRAEVERRLCALLGEMPRAPLRFEPRMPFASGHGRRLLALLHWATLEFQQHDDYLRRPVIARDFESLVIDTLLTMQPHNYSDALRAGRQGIASRDVRRAAEFICANLLSPITLGDIAAAAGVPGRTLLMHFRDRYGVSPMRYVRNLRMLGVRDDLARGNARSVRECALKWGFPHAGRFSIEYARRFGESPSATLRAGRPG